MKLGCCYFPEHWPEEMWAYDARRMREMGLSLVRIGEFAWSRIEPDPGRYDWAWLDEAVAALAPYADRSLEGLDAVAPLIELQREWSQVPGPGEVLIETTKTRSGYHWSLFPFEGRLVHEGLASLFAYRITQREPRTINLTVNDYGIELLTDTELPLDASDWRSLLAEEELLPHLMECVNATQMARRQFRDIARVAGLIHQGYPGQPKLGRQLQASSEMFFDVFKDYDPHNLLLQQARREVLDQQLEFDRLRAALQRIATQELLIVPTQRLTPLSFPLNAERLRAQHVSSEKWSDRIRRLVQQLERAADRTVQHA